VRYKPYLTSRFCEVELGLKLISNSGHQNSTMYIGIHLEKILATSIFRKITLSILPF